MEGLRARLAADELAAVFTDHTFIRIPIGIGFFVWVVLIAITIGIVRGASRFIFFALCLLHPIAATSLLLTHGKGPAAPPHARKRKTKGGDNLGEIPPLIDGRVARSGPLK